MKRLLTIIFTIIISIIGINNVKALTVSEDTIKMDPGKEKRITIYANTESPIQVVEFDLYFTTYDVPANFNATNGIIDTTPNGPHHKLTLSTTAEGQILLGEVVINTKTNPQVNSGTINIQNVTAITEEGETIKLNNKNIEVTIIKEEKKEETKQEETKQEETKKEPQTTTTNNTNNTTNNTTNNNNNTNNNNTSSNTTKENYNLLKKIDSKIVKIDIQENIYEYKVVIQNDIEELDLVPIAIKENYKIEISSQIISELKDNAITIKVTDDQKHTQEYTIKVETLKEVENVEIDKNDFKEKNNYQGTWLIIIIILSIFMFLGLFLLKKGK